MKKIRNWRLDPGEMPGESKFTPTYKGEMHTSWGMGYVSHKSVVKIFIIEISHRDLICMAT